MSLPVLKDVAGDVDELLSDELFSESLALSCFSGKFLMMFSPWMSKFVGRYFGAVSGMNSGLKERRLSEFGVCHPSENACRFTAGFEKLDSIFTKLFGDKFSSPETQNISLDLNNPGV